MFMFQDAAAAAASPARLSAARYINLQMHGSHVMALLLSVP